MKDFNISFVVGVHIEVKPYFLDRDCMAPFNKGVIQSGVDKDHENEA